MNNAMLGSPVVYHRQLRQAAAAPSSVRATPDLETAATAYMAGLAASQQTADAQAKKTDLQEANLAEKARQFSATLAEKARQFDSTIQKEDREFASKLADQRKYMDDWEQQNKWATAIGVMNLAAQGVSSWDQTKKLEAQQSKQQQLIDLTQQQVDMTKRYNLQDLANIRKQYPGKSAPDVSLYDRRTNEANLRL